MRMVDIRAIEQTERDRKADFMEKFLLTRAGTTDYSSENVKYTLKYAEEAYNMLRRIRSIGVL